MPTAPSMGHQARLGMSASGSASEAYEFNSESMAKTGTHVQTGGIRTTRHHIGNNVTDGMIAVGGSVTLHPTKVNLDNLLPRIQGAAEATDVFNPAETIPDFNYVIDRIAKVFTYSGCKVNKATFKSAKGNPLELTLDIQGKAESVGAAGTFPVLTLETAKPYTWYQAVVTLGGSTREVDNIEISIDNALILDRYNNSQTRTALPEGDRIVTFSCDLPYTADEVALYDSGITGAAGTVVFTNGSNVLTFTFANLKAPARSPNVAARSAEIPLRLEMTAFNDATTTKELVITST